MPVVTNLTIFVAAFKLSPSERARDPLSQSHAHGIWYDNSRFSFKNVACWTDEEDTTEALYDAILWAIKDAPHHYSLTIETDDRTVAFNCNQDIDERQKYLTVGRPNPADDFEKGDYGVTQEIAREVEKRTRRGDCFVDIVYSGEDPTAAQGLKNAQE